MIKTTRHYKLSSESWLPQVALEAKRWILVAKSSLFFTFPVCMLIGVYLMLTRSIYVGVVLLLLSALSVMLIFLNDVLLIKPANVGKFGSMGRRLKIFCPLGFCCLVVPGIFYLFAYFHLKEMFRPQTQKYPSGYGDSLKTYPSGSDALSEDGYTLSKEE